MTHKEYYVAGHTAKGFVNYLSENVRGISKIYALEHPSHTYKTEIIKKLIATFSTSDDLEIILSPFGKNYLEGLIVRKHSLAIVTKEIVTDDISYIPINVERYDMEEYTSIISKSAQLYDGAYHHFSQALAIHDDLEKIFINEMNFSKADEIADTFIQGLLKEQTDRQNQTTKPKKYHRLLGTNTAEGAVNVVPYLIQDIKNRVYIKGRAGTGKSVFMKKIAQACQEKGLDLELYHCSFDPDSIDMVIVPTLDFCIFDSTEPHAFSPERETDMVIDLYERTVTPGTDEKYALMIHDVSKRYKQSLKNGTQLLKEVAFNEGKLEQNFMNIDSEKIAQIVGNILTKIEYI